MSWLSSWRPSFPEGRIERIYLHWSGGDYTTVYPSYHYCITYDPVRGVEAIATHDLRANMRDVYLDAAAEYAAHTYRRNSYAAGLSVMAMKDARPQDFGDFPLREDMIDAMCGVAAAIATQYGIPVDAEHIMTHAEAAVQDGYFGSAEDERWDIACLEPLARSLTPDDALRTGDVLRDRIREQEKIWTAGLS